MVEEKADFATFTDGNDSTPAVQAGVGRAVVVAAVVSTLAMVVLLEMVRQLMVHFGQASLGLQAVLLLALFVLPGVGAGLVGNVRGCGLGTAVGVVSGGLWVLYRWWLTPPSKMEPQDRQFFGAYLMWMFGGPQPKEFGWMNIKGGTDALRTSIWILIVMACVTNVATAILTAVLVRQFRGNR